MDLKSRLGDFEKALEELEASARKLRNQNFADIVKSAKARVQQLQDHPDLHLAQKEMSGPEQFPPVGGEPMPFREPFPGSEIGGPDRGKPDTHVPGEPQFDRPNQNFQQPDAVDLNADGTLKQAPNSFGQSDVREG